MSRGRESDHDVRNLQEESDSEEKRAGRRTLTPAARRFVFFTSKNDKVRYSISGNIFPHHTHATKLRHAYYKIRFHLTLTHLDGA